MVAVHGGAGPLSDGRVDHIGRLSQDVRELRSFQIAEIAQNIALGSTMLGPPDADSTSIKALAPAMLHDRSKPIVAGDAASDLQAHGPEREVQLIVDHDHVRKLDSEEVHGELH